MEDVAIAYEKVKISEQLPIYILKPIDSIVGFYNKELNIFETDEGTYYDFNNSERLDKEYNFFGNPTTLEKLKALTSIGRGKNDYEFIVLDSYYQEYASNILLATIKANNVEIKPINYDNLVKNMAQEDMQDFVIKNNYISIMYEKIEIMGTNKPTYMLKPCGVMYGMYNKENDTFIVEDNVYLSYDNKENIEKPITNYFGEVNKLSDLIELDEISDLELQDLSKKYLDSHVTNMCFLTSSDESIKYRFNINEMTRQEEIKEKTEKDEIIEETLEENLAIFDEEINDNDKIVIYDFYRQLLRFCYVDGEINGVKASDINKDTFRLAINSLSEMKRAIEGLGIDIEMERLFEKEVKIYQYQSKEKTLDKDLISEYDNINNYSKIETKVENNNYDPNKPKYPEYSFDDLYKGITNVVIAQDEHIEKIVSVLYKRLVELNIDKNLPSQFGLMVSGSTGVGKSEIFKTFASLVDLPIQFMDATQITSAGYKGRDIESYLEELYNKYRGNIDLIKNAIIILDEVDKIKANQGEDGKDVNGKAVQDMFLKFMDGTDYDLGSSNVLKGSTIINTSNMTPISIGAFSDIYRNRQEEKNILGFGGIEQHKEKEITTIDFIDYGMSDEFMGRHYIDVHLNDLDVNAMLRILNESSKSPLKVQKAIFESLGIDVKFTYEYKKAVANEAIKRKTGARSLAGIVANTTLYPVAEIDRHRGEYNKLVFNKETVENPKRFILRRD